MARSTLAYNAFMLRAAALILLLVCLVPEYVQAQRGGGFAGSPTRSAFAAPHLFANRFPRSGAFATHYHRRHNGYGLFFYPDYWPYEEETDYDRPYIEVIEHEPAAVLPAAPEAPPSKAKVIEIPAVANSAAAKPLPPAIFILANGERLEASRFLLTSAYLSVNLNRRQLTIPLDQLDLAATAEANRERGIDLRVPDDQHEVLLSF